MARILALLLVLLLLGNGNLMLLPPQVWHVAVPGITETGPAGSWPARSVGDEAAMPA